ncbi:MAG: alpha/beta hydrolase [Gemmatimonadota bacterium]|nr:alpha/beta hydrolase [Gemmatimonadota bacterium]
MRVLFDAKLLPVFLAHALGASGLGGQTVDDADAEVSGAEVELTPCPAGQLGGPLGIETFLCGSYRVFEDRDAMTGRTIDLKITVVPAIAGDSAPGAPVFALAGGPGEAAHNVMAGAYLTIGPDAMRNRDLVAVDIRGTGGSNPLDCPPLGPEDRVQSWLYYILPFDEAARCAEALADRADLTQYTTARAADDVDEVREALGYDRFVLWGGSYGTLLGQEIIRRHEPSVEAAVLLAIAPPGLHAPMGFARSLETTRERLIADCAGDERCSEAFPTFADDFEAVLAAAREAPVEAVVTSPINGEDEPVSLEYGDFVMGIRFVLYNAASAASMPGWIASARDGDHRPLMQAVANAVYGIRQILHYGLFLSMRCSEDLPFVDVEAERRDAAGTMLGTYRMDRELENCTVWPRAPLYEGRHDAVESDVPVLLLSGSEDPVTPPAYGDRVAATLPNALHVVFENRGHGFFDPAGLTCLRNIAGQFLAGLSPVDTACAAELERLPFRVAGG